VAAFLLGIVLGIVLGALVGVAGTWVLLRRHGRAAPASPGDPVLRRADLLSKISHELRNPIMSIKGLASTGSRLYPSLDDAERQDLFRLIDLEAARLRLVADQTSTTLKIDAGTLPYDLRREDVGRVVEETAWRTPVGDHPVSVRAEVDLRARVDRTRIAEVVTNLVDNAAKFSPAEAPIEVVAARAEGGIGIEVRDAGPGIPQDRRATAFDRYGSWRPPGYEEVPGAGLGLFIASAHVRAHGGRLDIVDVEPHGTILRVWLPSGG
jgi:two-component system sensor histidine kinase KdpD